jgi:hypothetical protein
LRAAGVEARRYVGVTVLSTVTISHISNDMRIVKEVDITFPSQFSSSEEARLQLRLGAEHRGLG